MNRRLTKITLIVLGVLLIPAALFASLQGDLLNRGILLDNNGLEVLGGSISVSGDLTAGNDLTVTNDATVSGDLAVTGGITQKASILTSSVVSLTSPTVTFSAAGKGLIILNTDTNLTGFYPTGGTLNQVITIKSGAGTNTERFDDGTSMSVGTNVTLTEGQNDVLTLLCTSADGDEWAAISAHDN